MPSDKGHSNVTIHWFRHGLRLHDNPALLEGIKNCDAFYPVYILDGKVAGTETAGYNRWRFMLESLEDLDRSFKKLGGQLYVFKGDPVDVFRKLFSEWGVTKLTFELDPEPIWRERDELVKNLCIQKKVNCIEMVSHTLWDPRLISKKNGGVPPVTYMLFNQVARSLGPPSRPMPLPDFQGISLASKENNGFRVPSLEHLGIKPECEEQNKRVNKWEGGEAVALSLFETRMKIEEKAFEANKVLPNQSQVDLIGPPLSMSAHLRFGCMSIRKLYWGIVDKYKQVQGEEAPLSATAQLMWREYFYTMSLNNIKYNKVEGNPICLNVPWHTDDEKLNRWLNHYGGRKLARAQQKPTTIRRLLADLPTYSWKGFQPELVFTRSDCIGGRVQGQTGFPWIDAIMNQLRHEGWIHQVARHATACFLTRGDLWLSWEKGLEVFYKYLLDADWSVCAGNWMWVASSAFEDVLQCPKCFCPVRYGIRMDPKGAYIRRYVPVLKDMPLKYLFSPWTAPLSVQENAQCIVGKDYPKPIVDHYKVAKENKKYMDEVKELLKREKDTPHCAPCNQAEVGQFAFLPEYEDPQIKCLSSETCHALKISTD